MEQADLRRPIKIRFGLCGGRLQQGKMVLACRLHGRRAQQKENGGCPSSPCPEATQLGLSLYVSGTSQAAILPPELRVSACEKVSPWAALLRRRLDFLLPSVSLRRPESPLIFTARFVGTPLPDTGTLG